MFRTAAPVTVWDLLVGCGIQDPQGCLEYSEGDVAGKGTSLPAGKDSVGCTINKSPLFNYYLEANPSAELRTFTWVVFPQHFASFARFIRNSL